MVFELFTARLLFHAIAEEETKIVFGAVDQVRKRKVDQLLAQYAKVRDNLVQSKALFLQPLVVGKSEVVATGML